MGRISRLTKQKQILENELLKFTTFFSAEDLYQKILSKEKGLGIATIYRFLNEKVKQGQIHSFQCEKKTIYSTSQKNHAHFRCEKCKKTIHLKIDKLDFFKDKSNGEPCHFQLDITGICKSCQK